jgi:hypothetical protein
MREQCKDADRLTIDPYGHTETGLEAAVASEAILEDARDEWVLHRAMVAATLKRRLSFLRARVKTKMRSVIGEERQVSLIVSNDACGHRTQTLEYVANVERTSKRRQQLVEHVDMIGLGRVKVGSHKVAFNSC